MSYTGGYVPRSEASVLFDTRRLDRIIEINADDMYVTAEAGCTWAALYDALTPFRLRPPHFGPASGRLSTIGGSLSQHSAFFGSVTFDVQSIPLETVVASIRRIEWEEAPPNFLVVFPEGALDGAPQFHVVVSRVDTREASAAIQRRLVRDFPNVAIIDLKSVMQTIDDILGDITFIIRFMAMFSVVTGGVVLVAAVVTSRLQRIREGVLLRTLGASRAQIYRILLAEYLFLGSFAALTGLLLSLIAAWSLARYLFEVVFEAPLGVLGGSAALIVAVTVVVGMLNSRGICSRPPLEVLRSEVL